MMKLLIQEPSMTTTDKELRTAVHEKLELEALHRLDEECFQLQRVGDYLQAFEKMERALVLRRHFFGVDSDEVVHACKALGEMCNLLSMSFLQKDDFHVTLELLKKAEILTQHDPPLKATTLNNLACYYRRLGKLHAALSCLKKALDIEIRLSNSRNAADTHLNLCAVLSQLGKHKEALEHSQTALATLHQEFFQTQANLVQGGEESNPNPTMQTTSESPQPQHESDTNGTPPLVQPSKEVAYDTLTKDRVSVMCIAYHNIGVEYEYLKNFEECVATYKKGVGIAEQFLGTNHTITTTIRNSYLAARRALAVKRKHAASTETQSPGKASMRLRNTGAISPLDDKLRLPSPRELLDSIPSPRTIISEALTKRAETSPKTSKKVNSPSSSAAHSGKTAVPPLPTTKMLSPEDPFFSPRFDFKQSVIGKAQQEQMVDSVVATSSSPINSGSLPSPLVHEEPPTIVQNTKKTSTPRCAPRSARSPRVVELQPLEPVRANHQEPAVMQENATNGDRVPIIDEAEPKATPKTSARGTSAHSSPRTTRKSARSTESPSKPPTQTSPRTTRKTERSQDDTRPTSSKGKASTPRSARKPVKETALSSSTETQAPPNATEDVVRSQPDTQLIELRITQDTVPMVAAPSDHSDGQTPARSELPQRKDQTQVTLGGDSGHLALAHDSPDSSHDQASSVQDLIPDKSQIEHQENASAQQSAGTLDAAAEEGLQQEQSSLQQPAGTLDAAAEEGLQQEQSSLQQPAGTLDVVAEASLQEEQSSLQQSAGTLDVVAEASLQEEQSSLQQSAGTLDVVAEASLQEEQPAGTLSGFVEGDHQHSPVIMDTQSPGGYGHEQLSSESTYYAEDVQPADQEYHQDHHIAVQHDVLPEHAEEVVQSYVDHQLLGGNDPTVHEISDYQSHQEAALDTPVDQHYEQTGADEMTSEHQEQWAAYWQQQQQQEEGTHQSADGTDGNSYHDQQPNGESVDYPTEIPQEGYNDASIPTESGDALPPVEEPHHDPNADQPAQDQSTYL